MVAPRLGTSQLGLRLLYSICDNPQRGNGGRGENHIVALTRICQGEGGSDSAKSAGRLSLPMACIFFRSFKS